MPGIGIGIGIGFGRGGPSLAGGRMAAVSGPAAFSALGSEWTWGALDTDAWLRADFAASITVGAEATLAAVSTWDAWRYTFSADGDWIRASDIAWGSALEHFIGRAPASAVDGPCGFDLELRRGAPPPGETDSVVRVWGPYGACYVDVSLDDGSVIGGTYDYCDVDPLGETADAGYRVQVGFGTFFAASGEPCRISLLVDGSNTYLDADGSGFFRIKDAADAWQQRVERWTDMRIGGYFEQTTEAEQPILWRDSRGACLVFTGAQTMAGHDWITTPNGTAAPVSVAVACECALTDRVPLAWRDTDVGEVIELRQRTAATGWVFKRQAQGGSLVEVTAAQGTPFAGVIVARYDGANLNLRANGVDAESAAQAGVTAMDTLTLGGRHAVDARFIGRIREVVIDASGWSAAAANALEVTGRAKWGYV